MVQFQKTKYMTINSIQWAVGAYKSVIRNKKVWNRLIVYSQGNNNEDRSKKFNTSTEYVGW
jgi:hypothetical protein